MLPCDRLTDNSGTGLKGPELPAIFFVVGYKFTGVGAGKISPPAVLITAE